MNEFETYSIATQLVVAVGTMAVAIVAVWGDFIRSVLASPKLQVSLFLREGEPTKYSDGRNVRYYHLLVKNKRKWAPAKNVLVHITLLERPGPDGEWQPAMYSGQVPLIWQFGDYYSGLPSIGRERICDLGRIAEGGGFELKTQFRPNNFDCSVKGNQSIRVHLQAVSDNGHSNVLVLEIAWDGKWNLGSKEMASHLVIKEVSGK